MVDNHDELMRVGSGDCTFVRGDRKGIARTDRRSGREITIYGIGEPTFRETR